MDDGGPKKAPSRPLPAFGAVEGVRRDIQAAKEGYDPQGVGVAWTHDFLNKKPWHPMNFRNRVKVWEAEQEHTKDQQLKERGRQEFEAEQEYLKTLSMLSAEEQEKYRLRQAVSWMYQKPPTLNQPPPPQQQQQQQGKDSQGGTAAAAAAAAAAGGPSSSTGRQNYKSSIHQSGGGGGGGKYLAKVVSGVKAVAQQRNENNYELKNSGDGALGVVIQPWGGASLDAENQRFVVGNQNGMDSDEEERMYKIAMMSEEEKMVLRRKKEEERRQKKKEGERLRQLEEEKRLKEAKEFLKMAGIDVPESSSSSGSSSSSERDSSSDDEKSNGSGNKLRQVEHSSGRIRKKRGRRRKHGRRRRARV